MKLNRKFLPKLIRGLVSLSVLLGVCAMLFPLPVAPLPPNSPEKDSSEPFPCQNRPCGCRSAEQCWKKCCCFNDAQKVAWAKANNVKVPDFVLAAAKKAENKGNVAPEVCAASAPDACQSPTSKSAASCQHCLKKSRVAPKPSCCEKAAKPKVLTLVASKPRSCKSCVAFPMKSDELTVKSSRSKWVLVIHAAECQGQGPTAFCFPISIVPERITVVMPTVVMIEQLSLESERLHLTSLRPPLPPPKIV